MHRVGLTAAAGVLALLCLVAFWNSLGAAFLLDNQAIILNDPRIRAIDWGHVRDIVTRHYWWPSLESRLFRPLTTLSYALNYAGLGNATDPFGYHVENLILHWANALLAFALIRSISSRAWAALAAASLFAVHPLTVESVTNVVGRADLLAAMSVMGGLLLYRRFLAASGRSAGAWLAALGGVYLAGVFCKEGAVVLPGLMVLHDLAFPPAASERMAGAWRRSLRRTWPAYLAVLPGLLGLLAARWALFRHALLFGEFGSDNPIAIAPLGTAVMTAIKVLGYYLALIVWPAKLSCDYSYNAITLFGGTLMSGQDLHAWLALIVVALLAILTVVSWTRGHRAACFLLALAGVAFLPTANLVFPIGTIMAERLMYLPLVGIAGAVALLVSAAAAGPVPTTDARKLRRHGGAAIALLLLAIAALTARTIARNDDWTSNASLWTASAAAAPDSIKVIRGLAFSAIEADPSGGRVEQAIATASRGVRILEQHPLPLIHTPAALYQDIGSYQVMQATQLAQRGEQANAQAVLREALPMFERAAEIDRAINDENRRLARARGERPELVYDTGTGSIYRYLGTTYGVLGDPVRAAATFAYLEHIQPDSDDAHFSRGVAEGALAEFERGQGRMDAWRRHLNEAARSLIEATVLRPEHAAAWQTLERVYGSLAPGEPAVVTTGGRFTLNRGQALVQRHFQEACVELVRQLSEAGSFDDAARWRRRMTDEFRVPAIVFDGLPVSARHD